MSARAKSAGAGCVPRALPLGPRFVIDREAVLARWAAGAEAKRIAAALGCTPRRVDQLVAAARAQGDARAVRRRGAR